MSSVDYISLNPSHCKSKHELNFKILRYHINSTCKLLLFDVHFQYPEGKKHNHVTFLTLYIDEKPQLIY